MARRTNRGPAMKFRNPFIWSFRRDRGPPSRMDVRDPAWTDPCERAVRPRPLPVAQCKRCEDGTCPHHQQTEVYFGGPIGEGMTRA